MRFNKLAIMVLMLGLSFSAVTAKQIDFLASGVQNNLSKPNANGKVYFYSSSARSTQKTVWADANKTTVLTQPINLNIRGQATVFGDGTYYITVKDKANVTLSTFDFFNYSSTPSGNIGGYVDVLYTYGSNTSALQAAITAAGSNPTSLLFQAGSYVVSGPLTFPSNITLKFLQGAYLNISIGNSVYINGPVEAGAYAIKQGAGNVYIASAPNEIQFSAWGATPSPSPNWQMDFNGNIKVYAGGNDLTPNIQLINNMTSKNLYIGESSIDSYRSTLNINMLSTRNVDIGGELSVGTINAINAAMTTVSIGSATISTASIGRLAITGNIISSQSTININANPSNNRVVVSRLFGSVVTMNAARNVACFATEDAVVSFTAYVADDAHFYLYVGKTNPPSNLYYEFYAGGGTGLDYTIPVCFPVRKGEYWMFDGNSTTGTVYITPISG